LEDPKVKDLSVKDRRYLSNQTNKYQRKPKVGTPTLGRETAYVTEVGLGNLRSETAYDNTDVST
jgi:hypothetical protein